MNEEKNGESKSQKEQAEKKPNLNEEQYKLLLSCSEKKDVTDWNKYREEHPADPVLLQGANLSGAYLHAANLEETNLQGANLREAKLERANLRKANLQNADIIWANLQGANLRAANLQNADFQSANLQDANLSAGANLQGAKLVMANLQNADLRGAQLQGANFVRAIVDGGTIIWACRVNRFEGGSFTDFEGVGLDSARIAPEIKQLLEYNVRRKNWVEWYYNHPLLKWPAYLFWLISDYGLSTGRIIGSCILLVFFFAAIYFIWGYVDYYHGIKEPGIVKELFIAPKPEQMSDVYYCSMICFRSVCLSVATMFTFGDISVVNAQFGWKWWFSHFIPILQMVLGYMLLGALITRFAILFTAGGPAGKFAKSELKEKAR
jgi:uncharacterized protein YjbI with pentapeptide repeats